VADSAHITSATPIFRPKSSPGSISSAFVPSSSRCSRLSFLLDPTHSLFFLPSHSFLNQVALLLAVFSFRTPLACRQIWSMSRVRTTFAGCLVALQLATHSFGNPLLPPHVPILSPFSNSTLNSTGTLTNATHNTTTCSGCVLQAEGRATLSYPFEVEHVTTTVNVVPYITVFPNTTVTSFSTITPNATRGFFNTTSSPELHTELTWTWNGVHLYVRLDTDTASFL
jgi:hypothetical protein